MTVAEGASETDLSGKFSMDTNHYSQKPANVPFARQNELLSNPSTTHDTNSQFAILPGDQLVLKRGLKDYISDHLDVHRLNVVHDRLWRAGLPGRIQPLHHQRLMQRDIVATERIDLHLVWYVRWSSACNLITYIEI